MTLRLFAAGLALLVATVTLSCRHLMPERSIDYNQGRVPINLPRNIRSSEQDRDIDKPTAVIISVAGDGLFYVGKDRHGLNRVGVGNRLTEVLKDKPASDTMVYLAVSILADYGAVVEVCDVLVTRGVSRVGLLVHRTGYNTPSRLTVELQQPPDPNEDLSQTRPNPLTLVASISRNWKVTLNTQDMGDANDPSRLSVMLSQIFRQRADNYALRPGYETRTDLPLEERVEKTLTIKASKSNTYGSLIKVIDAAKGAGANPIILQLYDLAP